MSKAQIINPARLNQADKNFLGVHFTGDDKDWEKKKFKALKKKIRTHLWNEQERSCCYCKIKIKRRKQNSDLEHIIPKSRHPRFTFDPNNLALACKACNSSKNDQLPLMDQTVANRSLTTLPRATSKYNIVHPHKDDYFRYIEILDDVVIHSISDKGDKTVEYCNLHEPELALDRAEDIYNNQEDVKGMFIRLVLDLEVDGFPEDDDIFERIEEILDNV